MDGSQFDRWTRTLTTARSRRGLLAGIGAMGAGLLGARAVDAACPPRQVRAARGCVCKETGRPPVNGACPCPAGQFDAGDGSGCLECHGVLDVDSGTTIDVTFAGDCDFPCADSTECPDNWACIDDGFCLFAHCHPICP